ncbi:MAG: type transport system ATP-binding protein, partial [Actinomycetota bacterium]|nr:type transport system ATP-binding protein [Actinomycetota bacterium]
MAGVHKAAGRVRSLAAMALIRTDALTKRYSQVTAVSELTVEIEPGVVGLIGANGAGKSTLIKMIL